MNTTKLVCIDCGSTCQGSGQPKEVAKKNQWTHAARGAWRCGKCRQFLLNVGAIQDAKTKN